VSGLMLFEGNPNGNETADVILGRQLAWARRDDVELVESKGERGPAHYVVERYL
jgi:hypothetical protein